jgi:hypothetical protein
MDPQEPILEHLNGLYWEQHQGEAGLSPVQVARRQPTPEAIVTLRSNYAPAIARAAVEALVAERAAGVSPSGELNPHLNLSNPWTIFGFGLVMGAAAWLWTRRSRRK